MKRKKEIDEKPEVIQGEGTMTLPAVSFWIAKR